MEPFEKVKKVLKVGELWFDKSSSKCLVAITVILHIFLFELFLVLGLFHYTDVNNLIDFCEAISEIPLYIISCSKSLHFLINKNKIDLMLKDLKELIEHENCWIEKQNGRKLKQRIRQIVKLLKVFLAAGMAGVAASFLVPVLSHKLPMNLWFPYDHRNNEVWFWISVAYQEISGIVGVSMIIIIEMFPLYFMCYLIGIIEELCDQMEKICDVKIVKVKPKPQMTFNEKLVGFSKVAKRQSNEQNFEAKTEKFQKNQEKDKNLEELLKCIKIHQKIKSLTADVSDIFGKVIWLQGFLSTVILCTSAFSLTIVRQNIL